MKAIVEYGVRDGRWSKQVCPSIKAGMTLAEGLMWVLDISGAKLRPSKHMPRESAQSATHFVSLSLLDGAMRGDDHGAWRK